MDSQGSIIPPREKLSKVMKNVYDTFIECLGAASPEVAWATFSPVLNEGLEHAKERGRLDERKTRQQSLSDDIDNVKAMVKEAVSEAFNAPPPQRGRRSWPVAPRSATQPGPNAVFTHASASMWGRASSRNVTTVSPLWRRRAATATGA
ncbi:hypothetical protein E4U09_001996 [Claviceps aff. purpurea]|uniref:Uncharacterized protein n=1 Tax=Claviceps aff. purpurea TaxID=1967640 RepID=A0A9P7TZ02_9HYPO|nr:hypothetical protein E4U09_001996 [Claviceps aff. purpurea]